MPVIVEPPSDPALPMILGEEKRTAILALPVLACSPLLSGAAEPNPLAAPVLIAGEQDRRPLSGSYPVPPREVLRDWPGGTMLAANAGVATPCGAWLPMLPNECFISRFVQSTVRWQLAGITRDATGAALGNCRVIVLEVGQQFVQGAPIVAETTSDGSGNYTIEVPRNTAYQLLCYKAGSPDVAGASVNTLTPAAA